MELRGNGGARMTEHNTSGLHFVRALLFFSYLDFFVVSYLLLSLNLSTIHSWYVISILIIAPSVAHVFNPR